MVFDVLEYPERSFLADKKPNMFVVGTPAYVNISLKYKKKIDWRNHINTSKCVYWLDKHSVKVWWSYVISNTHAIHFCDIIFRHRTIFLTCPNKESLKLKIQSCSNDLDKYTFFLVDVSGLYISICRLYTCYRWWQTGRIPKLPTDRHFFYLLTHAYIWVIWV